MRIHVLSDLHNEFGPFAHGHADADVVVLAGDIDIGKKGVLWAASAFAGKPVIYVAGNHEYYGRAIPKLTNELIRLGASSGVSVLECSSATIDGIRFLGCTLWTDFRVTGNREASMAACADGMTDFRRIRVSPTFRRLRPADQAAWHGLSVEWLRAEIQRGDPQRTVVVTHHAPSIRSLSPRALADLLSGAYVSHLDALVAESVVPLWVHGHTHRAADYTIGATRVVSNPRGYPDEPIAGFVPDRVVELRAP